jgi:hypothetical protein
MATKRICGDCNCGTGLRTCRTYHQSAEGGTWWYDPDEGQQWIKCGIIDQILCFIRNLPLPFVTRAEPKTPDQKFEAWSGVKPQPRSETHSG